MEIPGSKDRLKKKVISLARLAPAIALVLAGCAPHVNSQIDCAASEKISEVGYTITLAEGQSEVVVMGNTVRKTATGWEIEIPQWDSVVYSELGTRLPRKTYPIAEGESRILPAHDKTGVNITALTISVTTVDGMAYVHVVETCLDPITVIEETPQQ